MTDGLQFPQGKNTSLSQTYLMVSTFTLSQIAPWVIQPLTWWANNTMFLSQFYSAVMGASWLWVGHLEVWESWILGPVRLSRYCLMMVNFFTYCCPCIINWLHPQGKWYRQLCIHPFDQFPLTHACQDSCITPDGTQIIVAGILKHGSETTIKVWTYQLTPRSHSCKHNQAPPQET